MEREQPGRPVNVAGRLVLLADEHGAPKLSEHRLRVWAPTVHEHVDPRVFVGLQQVA